MNEEKYLFVVSGPSGTGKDTVVHTLLEQHPELHKTISATTRARRGEEQDGREYHFLTVPQFEECIAQDGLVEHANYCGNYYGTLKSEVEPFMQSGTPVIMVIEVQGAGNIKRIYPGATTVFILPPNMEELERRLRSRGTDTEEAIQNRLRRAETEIALSADYDECVINDSVERCADAIYAIIEEKLKQQDSQFAAKVYDALHDYMVTDIGSKTASKIGEKLKQYKELELLTIAGENIIEDEHWAYHLDENSLQKTILQLFYQKV